MWGWRPSSTAYICILYSNNLVIIDSNFMILTSWGKNVRFFETWETSKCGQALTLFYVGGASSTARLLSCQETDGAGEAWPWQWDTASTTWFLHFQGRESRLLMQKIPNFIFPGQPSTPICFPHTYALCPVPRGACRLRKITGFCLANSSLTVASLSLNFPKQDPTHATNFLEPGVSIEASCGPGCILLRFFLGNCDSMLPSSCL